MKILASLVLSLLCLALAGCANPADDRRPKTDPQGKTTAQKTDKAGQASRELTPDEARELLPRAASLSLDELEDLIKHTPVRVRDIPNQSLTAVLLAIDPAAAQLQNSEIRGEFRYLNPDNHPPGRELVKALFGEDNSPFVSVIQPDYITNCTAISRGDTANGSVSYLAGDVYAGSADYTAKRDSGEWQIVAFHLSEYGLTTKRQPDGTWRLDSDEDLLGVYGP